MRRNTFVSMVDVVPEAHLDGCAIEHFEVSEHDSAMTGIRAMQHGPSALVRPGRYCRLMVGRTLMMTDTQAERRSNMWFVASATGDVFIAGLGIGMVLIPVLREKDVRSVTVIEKHQAVIDLVEPWILNVLSDREGAKLQIICEDIFDWKPPPRNSLRIPGTRDTLVGRWDTIYFDIWPDICGDNLPEITKLKRRFARRLNRDNKQAWMGAWEESTIRYQEKRSPW